MNKVYLITESRFDEEMLKKLLPESALPNVKFVGGSGDYSAQSLARSILAVRREPVALILDAKTTDPSLIQEHRDFLREVLGEAAAGAPFGIFLAEPELEVVFLETPDFLGNLYSHKLSPMELELAKSGPRKLLHLISGEQDRARLMKKLLRKIDEQTLRSIRKHPLLASLTEFLISPSAIDNENGHNAYELKSHTRPAAIPR